jgi:hypothetical protein
MARKSLPKSGPGPDGVDGRAITIVVRRGARKRFKALEQKTADLPVVLSWDRREGERRTSTRDVPDRRKRERRQDAPFSWTTADFLVVVPKQED